MGETTPFPLMGETVSSEETTKELSLVVETDSVSTTELFVTVF